ncbi:glutathione S-transferase [Legionella bozemanae]|uniref:glutathione S-transferase n=1 Tax=Legionella bozemanae TaxID=447 RepID=UPI001A9492D7|nr:glutathione S-transferase [Legionella bozemanae]
MNQLSELHSSYKLNNGLNSVDAPILYTFRRCPYAIRARMALVYSKIKVEQREVELKNKPQEMLLASPKGTVPVLILENGHVIDESIDIMIWALTQFDPEGWLSIGQKDKWHELIRLNDIKFKPILDNYKYPQKSEKKDPLYYREEAQEYLYKLNSLLIRNHFLLANHINIADIALFPFIRQFYMVDPQWFAQSDYKSLHAWLQFFLDSELFLTVMKKL